MVVCDTILVVQQLNLIVCCLSTFHVELVRVNDDIDPVAEWILEPEDWIKAMLDSSLEEVFLELGDLDFSCDLGAREIGSIEPPFQGIRSKSSQLVLVDVFWLGSVSASISCGVGSLSIQTSERIKLSSVILSESTKSWLRWHEDRMR